MENMSQERQNGLSGFWKKSNMKIEYTAGCLAYSLNIDGKPFADFDAEEKADISHKLVDAILMDYMAQDIIIDLLYQYGECEHLYHCEQCGDDVYSYTLKI